MNARSIHVLTAAVLSATACGDPVAPTPDAVDFLEESFDVVVESDIEYATGEVRHPPGVSEKLLHLDVYRPEPIGSPPLGPGLVLIHGGGLTRGDKTDASVADLAMNFAARGYAVFSINHRLTGDDPPTEHLATDPTDPVRVAAAAARVDAAAAIQWVRDHATEYRVDPNGIAVGGYSAGAATALGVAYWDPGVQRADVQAVLSLSGGLHGSEDRLDAGEPPLILIHGENDHARGVSEAMADRASLEGVPYEMYEIPGVAHGTPAALGTVVDGRAVREHVAHFFHAQLALGGL